ncbi:MAG: isopentenyl-diphosphate Delta-isomerase [Hyphomicrobiales bacterium]
MSPITTPKSTKPQITIPAIAEDGSLYPIEKLRAHELGVLHLAISAFVFSPRGELLIQRRAYEKYHCGGLWANTCCSHPHWQEDIADCAHRRMQEELGITLPLEPIGEVTYRADVGGGLTEHEHVHMFKGIADPQTWIPKPNPDEIAELRWVSMDRLFAENEQNPEHFTPWFRLYIQRWSDVWAPAA